MDPEPTPELNEALKTWRAGLTGLAPDDVAELEGHLLDSMAELRASGLTEAEAFEVAAARLGSPGELAAALSGRGGARLSHSMVGAAAEEGLGWRRVASWLLMLVGWFLLLGGVAAVLSAGWVAWVGLRPQPYYGRVLLDLPPPIRLKALEADGGEGGSIQPPATFEERVAAESEVMRSAPVLDRVVKRHDLVRRWGLAGPEQAIARLRSMVTLSTERGTDMVKLELRHTDPKETPWLANGVAEAYNAHQSEAWAQGRAEREQSMLRVLKEKEDAVEAARQALLSVTQQTGRSGIENPEGGTGAGIPAEGTPAAEARRWAEDRAKAAYQRAEAGLEEAKSAMRLLARLEGRASIHEYATEPIVYSASAARSRILAVGLLAGVGLVALAAGWTVKRWAKGRWIANKSVSA